METHRNLQVPFDPKGRPEKGRGGFGDSRVSDQRFEGVQAVHQVWSRTERLPVKNLIIFKSRFKNSQMLSQG